jgi:ABC-2 type transport system ATP-binding protein
VQWAVRDLSFELPERGIYGLLGSNGAGKSTLMNIICGVLKPTRGDVWIDGENIRTSPVEAKCNIGFLPQHPPLYPDMTVEEYLRYCGALRWIETARMAEAVGEAMEKCGIAHFRKRLLRNLSGGYQQRVGIAQAIIHKPALVVFDEPTNGLDPNQIIEVRGLIRDIAEHHTVILSTHILTEVRAICDHIFMVEQGQMVFSGSVDDFDNYIEPNSLSVTLMQPPSVQVLEAMEEITRVEESGGHRFRLWFSGGADAVTDRVVRASVANGWYLTEIGVDKNSLDSIFAELSKKKTYEEKK